MDTNTSNLIDNDSVGNPAENQNETRKRKQNEVNKNNMTGTKKRVFDFGVVNVSGTGKDKTLLQQSIAATELEQQLGVATYQLSKYKYFEPTDLNFHHYDMSVSIVEDLKNGYKYSLLAFGKCGSKYKTIKLPIRILPQLTQKLIDIYVFHGRSLPASICDCYNDDDATPIDWYDHLSKSFKFDDNYYSVSLSKEKEECLVNIKKEGSTNTCKIPIKNFEVLIFALQNLIMYCNMILCNNCKDHKKIDGSDFEKVSNEFRNNWEEAHGLKLSNNKN